MANRSVLAVGTGDYLANPNSLLPAAKPSDEASWTSPPLTAINLAPKQSYLLKLTTHA
jgi:hypothetical protein